MLYPGASKTLVKPRRNLLRCSVNVTKAIPGELPLILTAQWMAFYRAAGIPPLALAIPVAQGGLSHLGRGVVSITAKVIKVVTIHLQ
jgi:hypothetical protein